MSEDGDKKPGKRRACTECHKGKSKCVYPQNGTDNRCERCIRLNKECMPHISRQGKRKTIDSLPDNYSAENFRQQQHSAAFAMRNSQAQVMDMIGSSDVSGFSAAAGGTASFLNSHNMMGAAAAAAAAAAAGGNNFNTDSSMNSHLANQIQNNALFAKNAGLLQQHQQQSYPGEASAGLNTILSRAMGDSRNNHTTSGANNVTGGNNFGISANLLSGMNPNTINRMINQLSSSTNDNSGTVGADLASNNLDLLYQAVNSQSNQYITGGNQLKGVTPPNSTNIGNNYNMLLSQDKMNGTTGKTKTYPSSVQSNSNNFANNNSKSVSLASSASGNNNNTGNIKAPTNSVSQVRAADSRLKKQKKHHKFFPPEYPPVSLLNSTSATGTPSSSQAGEENISRSSSTQNFITPEDAIGNVYMNACARDSDLTLTSLKNHYGLQCQIREWISMALARRSFALLSKASSLAHRCNMHMDRILSGLDDENDDSGEKKCAGPRMHYLLSMLLEPQSKIRIPIEDRHMLLPHFPPAFLSVIGCQNGKFFEESEIRNRWIIVRETRCGISRFFCSPAFERNVLCWAHVSQIYEDNLADIHSLIFVKDQFRRFLACNAYQIWSHSGEGMPPRPVHAPKTRIRLLSKRWGMAKYQDDGVTNPITKTMIQQVDDVMTLEMDLLFVSFPTMDKTTYYLEFFHSAKNNSSTPVVGNSSIPAGRLSNISLNMEAGGDLSEDRQQKSPESSSANPPTFDDIMESDEWVGIDDVMASGDINELMDALLN